MKKIITCLLVAVLMVTCMATGVFAAERGDTVTVNFSVVGNPGFNSYSVELVFDDSALELTGITQGEKAMMVFIGNAGTKTAGGMHPTGDITGDGVLFTATFKVKDTAAPGTYTVSTNPLDYAYNANGDEFYLNISGGSVTVTCSHNYVAGTAVAPTCEDKGYTPYTCSKCGDVVNKDEVAALNHNMQETAKEVAATCTTDGKTAVKTCANGCGKTEGGTVIPATGHKNTEVRNAKDATCNAEGYTGDTVCVDCGTKTATGTVIPATGKHNTEVRNAKDATCNAEGYTGDTYCKDCGTKTATGTAIPATGKHNTEVRDAKDATCNAEGYTGDTYCKDCGTKTATGTVIPATGKHNTEVRDAKEPTCKDEGYTGDTYCKDCGTKTATGTVIPATGVHTPGEVKKENVIPHTCTTDGSYDEVTYCTGCGIELSRVNKVDPAAHDHAAAVRENEVKGTCKTKHTYDSVVYCSVCNTEISRTKVVGELGGHEYGTNGKCTCCGKVKDPDLDKQPDTGDIFVEMAMYASLAALAVGAVVFARRKSRG